MTKLFIARLLYSVFIFIYPRNGETEILVFKLLLLLVTWSKISY